MKNSIYTITLLVIIVILSSCKTNTDTDSTNIDNLETVEKTFPDDFLGIYKGDLNIVNSRGSNSIPMEFHLMKTQDSMKFEYKIVYGGDPRNYNLIKTNNPNLFLVDENNGIILESAYSNNTLYSNFEVMGNFLNTIEVFHDDHMEFMITMARVQDTTRTGSAESAFVTNYPITVMQKAVLYKQEPVDSLATNSKLQ